MLVSRMLLDVTKYLHGKSPTRELNIHTIRGLAREFDTETVIEIPSKGTE